MSTKVRLRWRRSHDQWAATAGSVKYVITEWTVDMAPCYVLRVYGSDDGSAPYAVFSTYKGAIESASDHANKRFKLLAAVAESGLPPNYP